MQKETLQQHVRQQLSDGDIDSALDVLLQYGKQYYSRQFSGITALRARYLKAKRQYEVQGVIVKQDFDLVFAQTLNGIQQILENTEIGQIEPLPPASSKKVWYARSVLLAIVILFCIVIFKSINKTPANNLQHQKEQQIETPPPEQKKVQTPLKEKRETEVTKTGRDQKLNHDQDVPKSKRQKESTLSEQPLTESSSFFTIYVVVNAAWSDAILYVDTEPAVMIKNTANIKTVRVLQKKDNRVHHFELRKNGQAACVKNQLIVEDNVKINMMCD